MDSHQNKKKAIISTFTYGNNYGQRLQNLALQILLGKYEYETWTFEQPDSAYKKRMTKKHLKNPKSIYAEEKRSKKFNQFNKDNIRIYKASSPMGNLYEERLKDQFDLFVTGSDQVWNPFSPDVNESHFLDFVPPERKLAFAPSFSVDALPCEEEDKYRRFLMLFSDRRLSVRETKGAEIIKNLIGIDVPVILDPTLMLDKDDWMAYTSEPKIKIPDHYILIYILGQYDYQNIKNLYPSMQFIDMKNNYNFYSNIGPSEFLWVIQNAEMVLTDSYHCMIFSLLFQKDFRLLERNSNGFSMQSRFQTVFDKFDIPKEKITIQSSEKFKLAYDNFQDCLEKERAITKNFLKNAEI